ncbi:sigma-70 family RNA polymerase sigma factor [Rhizobium rhizogenes]|uniref:sigma-70 family RNA polymerase sigma factor n=1 Tax=Rhizobium rhizogenes TaxID=359 RepID=UPI00226F9483|nr:sigma-70 family RNA polymerase sigma factor [Rhizobium rhizogenes]
MTDAQMISSISFDRQLHTVTLNWLRTSAIHSLQQFAARLAAILAGESERGRATPACPNLMTATGLGDTAKPHARTISSADETMRHFQRTIIPHLDAAYNFARFLSRDADAAQDIVQEAFLRAYRGFGGFRDGDARAWTFTIVRNCYHAWLQEGRRKNRHEQPMTSGDDLSEDTPSPEAVSEEDTPEMALVRKTETLRVREVINMLPDAMREVLVLRELEDLSYKEIAEIIDAPIGTVMSRLARARRDFGEAWRSLDEKGAAR